MKCDDSREVRHFKGPLIPYLVIEQKDSGVFLAEGLK